MHSSLPNEPLFQSLRYPLCDDRNNGKGVLKMLFNEPDFIHKGQVIYKNGRIPWYHMVQRRILYMVHVLGEICLPYTEVMQENVLR